MKERLEKDFLRAVLDAIPSPVFIVDRDVRILDFNAAAAPLMGEQPSLTLHQRGGEALHCINSTQSPDGCGHSEHCKTCVIRTSVDDSYDNQKVSRRAAKMILMGKSSRTDLYLFVTAAPLHHRGNSYVVLTLENINELVELRKLIPICANCKRIRNEQEYWSTVEAYFKQHMDIDFTHGICPECFERLYPDLAVKMKLEGADPS